MARRLLQSVLLFITLTATLAACATQRNGFDLSNAAVPADEIRPGGPPRDGIPALNDPSFVDGASMDELRDADRILGLVVDGQAYAYPIRILNWHEMVNHSIGGEPVLVTYCPLCGTGMAFDPVVGGRTLTFGVSGLLYNSDLLMYDRQTESLWSQIHGEAISGPLKGQDLTQLPLEHTDWAGWLERHPHTKVLSFSTGHFRDYDRSPYRGYEQTPALFFPVKERDDRYHPKAWVIGMTQGDKARVWPFEELAAADGPVVEEWAGRKIKVHYDPVGRSARITDMEGNLLPSTQAYWFAWYAFHPESTVFKASN